MDDLHAIADEANARFTALDAAIQPQMLHRLVKLGLVQAHLLPVPDELLR